MGGGIGRGIEQQALRLDLVDDGRGPGEELGPGMISQRLGGVDTTYAILRLAERFEHKLNDGARFWEKVEFLPQVNKLQNFLVNAEVGVETSLTKTFSLRVTLQDNFINQPAPGRKSNDVRLISGLVYKF